MRYVLDRHELVARFVARMIPWIRDRGFGNCRAIGICDDKNELVAGLIYHELNPEAGLIEISGAALPGHQWATRETLRLMHAYPFGQCGCQMVVMKVHGSDERLLRQLAALGYDFIKVPRLFGRHEDGVLCCLTEEEWRSNRITKRLLRSHKQEQQQEAA